MAAYAQKEHFQQQQTRL